MVIRRGAVVVVALMLVTAACSESNDAAEPGVVTVELSGDEPSEPGFRYGVRLTTDADLIADRVWEDFDRRDGSWVTEVDVPAGRVWLHSLSPSHAGVCRTDIRVPPKVEVTVELNWTDGCLELAG